MKALLSLLLLCSACAFGQRRVNVETENTGLPPNAFLQSVNGVPATTNIYYKIVEGSPFFRPEWMKGSVTMVPEKEYKGITLKLDLMANELRFRDVKGEEMICSEPMRKVVLVDSATGMNYVFAHSSFVEEMASLTPAIWMEVRALGRACLYTQYKKTISETRPYGSATLEQYIVTLPIHYLVVNNKYIKVKKMGDVLNALTDKKAELQQWLKSHEVDGKSADGMTQVVEAYNSLFQKS